MKWYWLKLATESDNWQHCCLEFGIFDGDHFPVLLYKLWHQTQKTKECFSFIWRWRPLGMRSSNGVWDFIGWHATLHPIRLLLFMLKWGGGAGFFIKGFGEHVSEDCECCLCLYHDLDLEAQTLVQILLWQNDWELRMGRADDLSGNVSSHLSWFTVYPNPSITPPTHTQTH